MSLFLKNIPNILTIIRIILTPFIIYFTIINNIKICIILAITAAITDLLDGLIARKFNLISSFGAKLDTISDKLFAGTLIISLILKNNMFVLCLIGEITITIINLISFTKGKNPTTMYVGKIKTTILFISIILGYISIIYKDIKLIVNTSIIISFIFQLFSIISYLNYFISYEKIKN